VEECTPWTPLHEIGRKGGSDATPSCRPLVVVEDQEEELGRK